MNYKEFLTLLCWPPSINLTARIAPFTFLMTSNCGESSAPTNGRVAPVFNPLWFKKGAEDRGMVVSSLFGGRKWFLSIPISWYVSPDPSNISRSGNSSPRCSPLRHRSHIQRHGFIIWGRSALPRSPLSAGELPWLRREQCGGGECATIWSRWYLGHAIPWRTHIIRNHIIQC